MRLQKIQEPRIIMLFELYCIIVPESSTLGDYFNLETVLTSTYSKEWSEKHVESNILICITCFSCCQSTLRHPLLKMAKYL